MSKFALEISGLNKVYKTGSNGFQALDSVDLKIRQGSFFGLLGANGAGKSTLINILAGLVKKTSGQIKISQIDFDKDNLIAKGKIGIVPQEVSLDPFFTAREMIDIYAGYYGIPKKERKTDEILEALGLTDKRNVKSRGLSGGMKRRLLIAKALAHNPDIIILDEPTAGVDVQLRDQLWKYIKKLNKDFGKTIILTTHYLEEAEMLCDEIAFINKGRIIAQEKKEQLKKLFGKEYLSITVANKKDLLLKYLQKIEAVSLIEQQNNSLKISYKREFFSYNDLISIIHNNGIEIVDIRTEESDVEDIFRELLM